MKTFLTITKQNTNLPRAICCYIDGVKLACEGSPVLDELEALEAAGVHIILLSFPRFGRHGEWLVDIITSMREA